MIVLERLMARLAETGQGRVSDALKGRDYRLEADQFLAGVGVDPAKEPPVADPRANSASPPPAPPSPTPSVQR
jgi:hypothetical protein